MTRQVVMQMMVVLATVNGLILLSSSVNSVDDTLVGRWHICNEKKMQGFTPFHDGSQVQKRVRRQI